VCSSHRTGHETPDRSARASTLIREQGGGEQTKAGVALQHVLMERVKEVVTFRGVKTGRLHAC